MDHFSVDGTWWLVDTPDRRVPGTLTFNDEGLELVIYGSLPQTNDETAFPEWTQTPVILGKSYDGRNITLLKAEGANLTHHLTTRTNYKVRLALIGVHSIQDLFVGAYFELDCLNAWADPPPLTLNRTSPYDVRFDDVEMDHATVGQVQLALMAGVSGSVGPMKVHIDQNVALKLSLPPTPHHDIVNNWVRPFIDLLTACLGRAVRITNYQLLPAPDTSHDSLRAFFSGESFAAAYFPAIQAAPSNVPSVTDLLTYTSPTLLTYRNSPISFADLIPRWYQLRDELRNAYVLLTGPYHARFMFDEHRYSSTFQSAEAFVHSNRFVHQEKGSDVHSARVEAMVNAAAMAGVDSKDVEWARRVLQARNDKPLWKLVFELVSSTGEVGSAILTARPDFANVVASLRAGVSHPSKRRNIDYSERYWLADALRWVIRARTLIELGLSLSEVEGRVQSRDGFRRMLQEISAKPVPP